MQQMRETWLKVTTRSGHHVALPQNPPGRIAMRGFITQQEVEDAWVDTLYNGGRVVGISHNRQGAERFLEDCNCTACVTLRLFTL